MKMLRILAAAAVANCVAAAALAQEPGTGLLPRPSPTTYLSEVVRVAATPTRQVSITVLRPAARLKGVLIFSHGGNSNPDAYQRLYRRLTDAGYAVLAPLHVDSLQHPDAARYNLQSAFSERIADIGAAARLAGTRFPGLPVAAVGHSYGSLFVQIAGGAFDAMMHAKVPGLRAVVSFSSPGIIPGLVSPQAFATMTVPTLLVTGTNDTVPNFVTDWHDHLVSQRSAPAGAGAGDHYALVIDGGDHLMAGGADAAKFDRIVSAAITFLDAYVTGDVGARGRLAAAGLSREAQPAPVR